LSGYDRDHKSPSPFKGEGKLITTGRREEFSMPTSTFGLHEDSQPEQKKSRVGKLLFVVVVLGGVAAWFYFGMPM
jgi:hypothetical protein